MIVKKKIKDIINWLEVQIFNKKKISKNKKKLVNPKINKDTKINHYKINKEEDQNMKFFINNNSNTIYKHK